MNDLLNLFLGLGSSPEILNISDDKDYDKFNKCLDELEDSFKNDDSLISKLFINDETLEELREIGKALHENAKKKDCECEKCKCYEKKETPKKKIPELPSKKCTLNQQAQIHKLVTEYVDTMIRPNTDMPDNVINDTYAGLFEFACWVLKK